MNIQPAEKIANTDGSLLEVHSIFKTIQGEGPFTGHRSIFIRLSGCNLQCPMCDTEYTNNRTEMSVLMIVNALNQHDPNIKLVVITGGEPFRQNITLLVTLLLDMGFKVQIETNGTLGSNLPFRDVNLTVVCSPKGGPLNKNLIPFINNYKYVMGADNVDPFDGLPTSVLGRGIPPARPPAGFTGTVYLQPEDSGSSYQNCLNTEAVVESVQKHGYVLQLQIHKLLNVE